MYDLCVFIAVLRVLCMCFSIVLYAVVVRVVACHCRDTAAMECCLLSLSTGCLSLTG